MNQKLILAMTLILALLVSACTTYEPATEEITGEVIAEPTINEGIGEEADASEDAQTAEDEELIEIGEGSTDAEVPSVDETADVPEETAEEQNAADLGTEMAATDAALEEASIEAYEGDLIDLKPYVMDPDGDMVDLGYTSPFNDEGVWQTKEGDAGHYSVIVTATDNKDSFVTKQITIDVLKRNNPPVVNIGDNLEFEEGDMIKLNPDIYDPDGDEVVVIYSGWMDSREYQSNYEDAGVHDVRIRADDSQDIVTKDIKVTVLNVNRKPDVKFSDYKLKGTEGDMLQIDVEALDPDGDDLKITFSEPFDDEGRWQTAKGDAGTYEVLVTVSDGENEVTSEVLVELEKRNQEPVIKSVKVSPESIVLKKPGDKLTIKLDVEAVDPDGDALTYTFSGFMESAEKVVAYGEKGGMKTVQIEVSDGKDSVSTEVSFEMNNWPCFDCQIR